MRSTMMLRHWATQRSFAFTIGVTKAARCHHLAKIRSIPISLPQRSSAASTTSFSTIASQKYNDNNDDYQQLPLPPQYLRQMSQHNFDSLTNQRKNVKFDPKNGKPISSSFSSSECIDIAESWIQSASKDDDDDNNNESSSLSSQLVIRWNDDIISHYPLEWIHHESTTRYRQSESFYQNWLSRQKTLIIPFDDVILPITNPTTSTKTHVINRTLWPSHLSESHVRNPSNGMTLPLSSVVNSNGSSAALESLYRYGILLVTATPISSKSSHESSIAALASALSGGSRKSSSSAENHCIVTRYLSQDDEDSRETCPIVLPRGTDGPLRTVYGTVWSTCVEGMSDGGSLADSAYGMGALPLHTDLTYYMTPPGLQIFSMMQPATEGGQSIFADGFAAAKRLRRDHPDAFRILSSTIRRYRSVDRDTGWYLEAKGPVIQTSMDDDAVVTMIRHNDLDRLPDLPPSHNSGTTGDDGKGVCEFYEELRYAHEKWDEVLGRDESRLVVDLREGDTIVVANQRCCHGRYSFTATRDSPRMVMGCYVSQDELDSRFRQEGFIVD